MLNKTGAGGWAKILLIVMAILVTALAAAYFGGYFENAPPKISDVKIIKKDGRLTASYKRPGPAGPETEELISWYFNGIEQPQLKGLPSIPVPPVTDITIEIECSIRRIEGANVSKPVRSKKYRHFMKGAAPAAYSTAPTETVPANAPTGDQNAADTAETSSGENTARPPAPASDSTAAAEPPAPAKTAGQPAGTVENQTQNTPAPGPDDATAAAAETTTAAAEPPAAAEKKFDKPAKTFKTGTGIVFESNSTAAPRSSSQPPDGADSNKITGAVAARPAVIYTPVVNSAPLSWRSLHEAIVNNDFMQAQRMVHAGANVNAMDNNGQRPLHLAVSAESREIVDLLVRYGADIAARDNKGKTPLHVAAARKTARMALVLLDIEAAAIAAETDQVTLREYRLVNLVDDAFQFPLHTAAIYDAAEAAAALIAAGADVNAMDKKRSTPLHYAVLNKSRKIIPLLIEKGANVNAKDLYEQIPANLADGEIAPLLAPKDTKENSLKKPGNRAGK